jgi:hypothetical protein
MCGEGGRVTTEFPPSEAWAEFVKMRKSIKKPMTAYAEKLMLKRLRAFVDNGQDAKAMLDQSIVNCWQNIYEVKAEDPARGVAPLRGRPQLALVDQQRQNSAEAARLLADGDDAWRTFENAL